MIHKKTCKKTVREERMDDCLAIQINSFEYAEYWWKSGSLAQRHKIHHSKSKFVVSYLSATCGMLRRNLNTVTVCQSFEGKSSSENWCEMSEDVTVFTAVSYRILDCYPVKGSRSLRRNTKTWKIYKVFTGFKLSSSFPSTYLSWCPRPYLTSEFKYSQFLHSHETGPLRSYWINVFMKCDLHEWKKRAARQRCCSGLHSDDVIDDD